MWHQVGSTVRFYRFGYVASLIRDISWKCRDRGVADNLYEDRVSKLRAIEDRASPPRRR